MFSGSPQSTSCYSALDVAHALCFSQEMSTVPAKLTIPDGTPIQLQLTESVSSAHARAGDLLDFVVVKDVSVEGFTVIPAGTEQRFGRRSKAKEVREWEAT